MHSNRHILRLLAIGVVILGLASEKASSLAAPGSRASLSVLAGGENCAAAVPINALPFNDTGDTTTASNEMLFLGTTCAGGGAGSRPGRDLIYKITVTAGNSLTFQVTPQSTYDTAIYILSTCGDGATCIQHADAGIEGQTETIGPVSLAPGTHYLYIDSFYSEDEKEGFGTYTLSVTGTLGSGGLGNKFYTLTPCRLIDTRNAPGATGGPALVAGQDRTFPIVGLCGVPVGAKAVSINATVIPTTAGYLTAYPGGPRPLVSLINFKANQIRANNGIVSLAGNGTITVFNGAGGSTHFLLDVNGYFQ
jgi:hypothetical protein